MIYQITEKFHCLCEKLALNRALENFGENFKIKSKFVNNMTDNRQKFKIRLLNIFGFFMKNFMVKVMV